MNSGRMKSSEKQGREAKVHPIKCRVSKTRIDKKAFFKSSVNNRKILQKEKD